MVQNAAYVGDYPWCWPHAHDTPEEVAKRRSAFLRKWNARHTAIADSLDEFGDRLFTSRGFRRTSAKFKRRIKTQTVLPSSETGYVVLSTA